MLFFVWKKSRTISCFLSFFRLRLLYIYCSLSFRLLNSDPLWLYIFTISSLTSQWCHNERDGASKHRHLDCLFNILFMHQIKENIKASLAFWGEFTGDWWSAWQKASNAENVSLWWRHHVLPHWTMTRHMIMTTFCTALLPRAKFHGGFFLSERLLISSFFEICRNMPEPSRYYASALVLSRGRYLPRSGSLHRH